MAKKIGLITWFDSYNYGTCLQCYALSKFLDNAGYDVWVPNNLKYYYGIKHPIETICKILDKITKIIIKPNQALELPDKLKKSFEIRREKNHQFAYTENKIYRVNSKKEYDTMLASINIFIAGSDQIWNPKYVSPTMLLSFTNRRHKKIAYASSIGVLAIPKKSVKMYKKYLERFDYIGVREKSAQVLLSSIVSKNVVTVMDPTFLLDGFYWNQFASKHNEMVPKENYILCYFIGSNTAWYNDVKQLAQESSLKIIIALSESNLVPDFGEIVPDAGIADFISLISKASYVVTDSFHATALSINMNKEFIVYKRFANDTVVSQNSRIYNLLESYKLESRLVDESNSLKIIIKKNISYKTVNDMIEEDRKQSKQYLLNAIDSDEYEEK